MFFILHACWNFLFWRCGICVWCLEFKESIGCSHVGPVNKLMNAPNKSLMLWGSLQVLTSRISELIRESLRFESLMECVRMSDSMELIYLCDNCIKRLSCCLYLVSIWLAELLV